MSDDEVRPTVADYAFEIRAQQWSTDSYYVSSSSPVYKVTVVASTKAKAVTEAKRVLGAPERDRYWRFWVDAMRDARLVTLVSADPAVQS